MALLQAACSEKKDCEGLEDSPVLHKIIETNTEEKSLHKVQCHYIKKNSKCETKDKTEENRYPCQEPVKIQNHIL